MRHDPPAVMELTKAELQAIAARFEKTLSGDAHNLNITLSAYRQDLKHELHSMTSRGELTLCSRAERRGEFPCPTHPMQES